MCIYAAVVSDVSTGLPGTLLFESATGEAALPAPGIPGAVTSNFTFLGRTWQLVLSPSAALAASTTAALLARTVGIGVPTVCLVSICSVLFAVFVRRIRREAKDWSSFEAYVRAPPSCVSSCARLDA
jgi:hypothetical protein